MSHPQSQGPSMLGQIVLVPHDLTAFSDIAIDGALRFGARQLHIVYVLPRIDILTPGVVWSRDEDEPRRASAREALRAHFRDTDAHHATQHIRIGDPATQIVEVAREIGATLIAMPCHGRKSVERMLLGSVSEHVVRFAPCPVLVFPAVLLFPHPKEARAEPPDRTPEDQLETIAIAIIDRVGATTLHLSAARIGLPEASDAKWWEKLLEQRLAESGVEFVDFDFTTIPRNHAEILDLRFEPQ